MPEGHTLHRRARDHTGWFAGEVLSLSSPQGRFAEGARILDRCRLDRVEAIGKHLLYHFDEATIHVHLGLFGRFRIHRRPEPEPRGAVRLRMVGATRALDLVGPTDCSIWGPTQVDELRERLGPDPLDPKASPERFLANLARRRRPIGAVLLDQKAISGIGNVYRAELLFRAGLDPHTPAREVPEPDARALWDDAVALLELGVRYDRIVTTDPATVGRPYARMRRRERVHVYKQPACKRCDGNIVAEDMGSRTLYWCPGCQG